jgi:hypothetical protein
MIKVFLITTKNLTKDDDADLSSNLLMARSRRVWEKKSVREEEEEEEAQIRLWQEQKQIDYNTNCI